MGCLDWQACVLALESASCVLLRFVLLLLHTRQVAENLWVHCGSVRLHLQLPHTSCRSRAISMCRTKVDCAISVCTSLCCITKQWMAGLMQPRRHLPRQHAASLQNLPRLLATRAFDDGQMGDCIEMDHLSLRTTQLRRAVYRTRAAYYWRKTVCARCGLRRSAALYW